MELHRRNGEWENVKINYKEEGSSIYVSGGMVFERMFQNIKHEKHS